MEAQMKINGDMVRALREEKSWSQEHLADAAGLSARTVQRVEAEGVGSAETRLALAAALDVPVSTLMPSESPPPSRRQERWDRIPLGAWIGLGLGAACSIGAVAYTYVSGAASVGQASRNLGIVCALIGTSLGVMGAIRGWARSRATAV